MTAEQESKFHWQTWWQTWKETFTICRQTQVACRIACLAATMVAPEISVQADLAHLDLEPGGFGALRVNVTRDQRTGGRTYMKRTVAACWAVAVCAAVFATAQAETLKVGPGQKYGRPSIRGVGERRPRIDAKGKSAGNKGLWVQAADNLTVENIELVGSRSTHGNGAGIRAQASGLTVRHCRFYDCQDGIQGGAGEILVEHCEFDHCGHTARPTTHSCYISGRCTKLVFRYNYSTYTHEGHLLKTRAQESWVLYNRLTDEEGTGSAVADFPNGGLVVMIGNILHKGPKGQNNRLIAYGMEGVTHERNDLYVINNTMLWDNRRQAWFVRVEKAPEDFAAVIRNNVCIGPVPLTNNTRAHTAGNLVFSSTREAGFVDPAKYDFQLRADSPCIDRAVAAGTVGTFDLTPTMEYVHVASAEKRPNDGRLDVGAHEFRSKITTEVGAYGKGLAGDRPRTVVGVRPKHNDPSGIWRILADSFLPPTSPERRQGK